MLFEPIKPMLLTMRREAFDSNDWLYEIKWDGWRILLHKDGDRIEAYTRNGNCVTSKFPELRDVARNIRAHTAILDCEGVCIRDGRSVFDDFAYRGRLGSEMKVRAAAQTHPATFVAFDVLYTSRSHTGEPLVDRKARLADLIEPSSVLTPTMFVDGAGTALKRMTEERNLEGIVAKRKNSRYTVSTRSADWIKIKNFRQIDTVILGYRRQPQFGLIVGLHFPTVKYKAVATVEYGFRPEDKSAFLQVVPQLHTTRNRDVQWIEPVLSCRIQYLERTERHNLRIVSFKGFLPSKNPDECTWVS